MEIPKACRQIVILVSAGGLLLVNGCLANLEQNLDLVLSPGAAENALVLPYSPVNDLAYLLTRLWLG